MYPNQTNQTKFHLVTQLDGLLRIVPTPSNNDLVLTSFDVSEKTNFVLIDRLQAVTDHTRDVLTNGDDTQFDELILFLKDELIDYPHTSPAVQNNLQQFIDIYDLYKYPECVFYPTTKTMSELTAMVQAIPQDITSSGVVLAHNPSDPTDMATLTIEKVTSADITNLVNQHTLMTHTILTAN